LRALSAHGTACTGGTDFNATGRTTWTFRPLGARRACGALGTTLASQSLTCRTCCTYLSALTDDAGGADGAARACCSFSSDTHWPRHATLARGSDRTRLTGWADEAGDLDGFLGGCWLIDVNSRRFQRRIRDAGALIARVGCSIGLL
jgi:hypothetical protein